MPGRIDRARQGDVGRDTRRAAGAARLGLVHPDEEGDLDHAGAARHVLRASSEVVAHDRGADAPQRAGHDEDERESHQPAQPEGAAATHQPPGAEGRPLVLRPRRKPLPTPPH